MDPINPEVSPDVNTLDAIAPEQVVTETAPPNDPFEALLGVPDAVLLVCPVASKNLNLVDVPGMVVTVGAAIEVRFAPGFTVTTARENLKII